MFDSNFFLGEPLSYWVELKRLVTEVPPEVNDLIRENASLRAKVTYYEDKIRQMSNYGSTVDGSR